MWIKMVGKEHGIPVPDSVDRRRVSRKELVSALKRSSVGINSLLRLGCDCGGSIPIPSTYVWRHLPLDVGHLLTYFVAHEGHHRGQIVLLAPLRPRWTSAPGHHDASVLPSASRMKPFSWEDDARRITEVLPKRFGKYGLTLHPEKTRLVPFRRPRYPSESSDEGPRPGTFDLLGFTHFWGKSRKGYWIVKRKTAKDRFRRVLTGISRWCRDNRHLPVAEQHRGLASKLRGHYGYFGVTGNMPALLKCRCKVIFVWRNWLSRRSQRAWVSLERLRLLVRRYPLPMPVIVLSTYRQQRSLDLKSRMH